MAVPYSAEWYKGQIDSGVAKSQAAQLGISTNDLFNYYADQASQGRTLPINQPQTQGSITSLQGQFGGYSGSQGAPFGITQDTTAPVVQRYKALGGGGGKSAPAAPSGPDYSGWSDPGLEMNQLGAAALNMPLIGTSEPTGSDTKTGTTNLSGTKVYPVPPGKTAADMAPKGPWNEMPSVFTKAQAVAPTTTSTTPFTPAPQATAAQSVGAGTPFATAPGAPGVQIPAQPVKAPSFSQIFGDSPHQPMTYQSHTQKMATGGMVRGPSGPDRVPAMLTSGEYVLNKNAVNQIGVGNLNAMNAQGLEQGGPVQHFQTGGMVENQQERQQEVEPVINWNTNYQPPSSAGSALAQPLAKSNAAEQISKNWQKTTESIKSLGSAIGKGVQAQQGKSLLNTSQDPDPDTPYLQEAGMSGQGAATPAQTASTQFTTQPYRAMAYGPGTDKTSQATTVGRLGDLEHGDIAVSPNLLHRYPLGSHVNVVDNSGNVLVPNARVADTSWIKKGVPTTNSFEVWGGKDYGYAHLVPIADQETEEE